MSKITCFIEKNYKIDHSKVNDKHRNTFATLGKLFDGKPICAWCVARLALVADAYGHSQKGNVRGGTNVQALVSLDEMINKSPLKAVFADYNLEDIKHNLDRNLVELEPQIVIKPSIESEIARISGTRIVR